MDEITSYKMCAVKVRNAKLRNYLKSLCICNVNSGYLHTKQSEQTKISETK
jgi:hypothetical protein